MDVLSNFIRYDLFDGTENTCLKLALNETAHTRDVALVANLCVLAPVQRLLKSCGSKVIDPGQNCSYQCRISVSLARKLDSLKNKLLRVMVCMVHNASYAKPMLNRRLLRKISASRGIGKAYRRFHLLSQASSLLR